MNITKLLVLLSCFYCMGLLASPDSPLRFVKFTTDFDAKCVVRGGVMIYISNIHPSKKIKVTLERWYMDNRTADRGRSVLGANSSPEPLGCSLVSEGKQEWKVIASEWE